MEVRLLYLPPVGEIMTAVHSVYIYNVIPRAIAKKLYKKIPSKSLQINQYAILKNAEEPTGR